MIPWGKCSSSSATKVSTSGVQKLCSWSAKYKSKCRRCGETVTAEIPERRSWRSHRYWRGVSPSGAQVRRTTGWSIKPVSSRKTRVRPLRRAFFYTRPVLLTPPGDGFFVAFACPPFGFLATPADAPQHVPDPGRVVADAEMLLDHFGDPLQRPQVGHIPVGERALQQQTLQLPALRGPSAWAGDRDGAWPSSFPAPLAETSSSTATPRPARRRVSGPPRWDGDRLPTTRVPEVADIRALRVFLEFSCMRISIRHADLL